MYLFRSSAADVPSSSTRQTVLLRVIVTDRPVQDDGRGSEASRQLNIQPKVANFGHEQIVKHVLPRLFQLMQEPDWVAKPPLLQVREVLRHVESDGNRFWGQYLAFSRKRTVEDAVVTRYYGDLRLTL